MKNKYIYSLIVLITVITACKKPYLPPASSTSNSYLVVEGVINSAGDSTIIKLSRTVQLSGNAKANVLNGCTVTVEDEQGGSTLLQGTGNGKYVAPAIAIDAAKKYRLHIIVGDGSEYGSDYMAVKQTPPVDSVSFGVHNNSFNVYVNTHDPANNTRYYRWDFVETWKFHSMYDSKYKVAVDTLIPRADDEQIYYCFNGDTSSNIIIGTSEKLAQDVISQALLTSIPPNSEKMGIRYSILVKQYALTKDEYQFWQNLQKNTEQLGGIFDAQPSEISGNVHNLKKPSEPVIGYVSVTNIQTKRIFIDQYQDPINGIIDYPFGCEMNTATAQSDITSSIIQDPENSPINILLGPFGVILGYTYSSGLCVDCTLRGKSQVPSFWTDN